MFQSSPPGGVASGSTIASGGDGIGCLRRHQYRRNRRKGTAPRLSTSSGRRARWQRSSPVGLRRPIAGRQFDLLGWPLSQPRRYHPSGQITRFILTPFATRTDLSSREGCPTAKVEAGERHRPSVDVPGPLCGRLEPERASPSQSSRAMQRHRNAASFYFSRCLSKNAVTSVKYSLASGASGTNRY